MSKPISIRAPSPVVLGLLHHDKNSWNIFRGFVETKSVHLGRKYDKISKLLYEKVYKYEKNLKKEGDVAPPSPRLRLEDSKFKDLKIWRLKGSMISTYSEKL